MTIKPGSFKYILELPNIISACNGIKICTLQKGYAYSYFAKSILMQKLNQPHIDANAHALTHISTYKTGVRSPDYKCEP